jgi:hypothetical protein
LAKIEPFDGTLHLQFGAQVLTQCGLTRPITAGYGNNAGKKLVIG